MPYLEDVSKEIQREIKRAKEAGYLETKKELANTVYPLLLQTCEAIEEALAEFYSDLTEDSLIQPELGNQIFATLDLGDQIVALSGEAQESDIAKQKLKEAIEAWKIAAAITRENVSAAVVDDDDEEDLDDSDEDVEEDEPTAAEGEGEKGEE